MQLQLQRKETSEYKPWVKYFSAEPDQAPETATDIIQQTPLPMPNPFPMYNKRLEFSTDIHCGNICLNQFKEGLASRNRQ